jgi:hypothetical protein
MHLYKLLTKLLLRFIAVATAVRTWTFLWGREAPPQKRPKKNGYSYDLRSRLSGLQESSNLHKFPKSLKKPLHIV